MTFGTWKRWYRSRRNQLIMSLLLIFCIVYYIYLNNNYREPDLDITRRVVKSNPWPSIEHAKPIDKVMELIPPANLNSRNSVVQYTLGGAVELRNNVKGIKLCRSSIIFGSVFLTVPNGIAQGWDLLKYIEKRLELALKQDKGTGCEIPKLNPFAKEVVQFDKELPKVACSGQDWVRCYHSKCKVVPEILNNTKDIVCTYSDILYENDSKYTIGPPITTHNDEVYELVKSDHIKVKCSGKHIDSYLPSKWVGHSIGFRSSIHPKPAMEGNPINVLIIGFDSTAKNGFIRRMPKSYKVLTEQLDATVLNGYNIVGDGTPASLFPIMTGRTELEFPDVRRRAKNYGTLDASQFIFDKLKEYGYRTAYFEDMPWIGTFQYRFNGFNHQPADHYLRPFYLEESNNGKTWQKKQLRYCVGDTPRYKLMLQITEQFLKLEGRRYCFTFIADITHDDFNMISTADDEFAQFLLGFLKQFREDTLLFVMGDHGPRYANVRDTFQGKLEERLPLMAIRLPDVVVRNNPEMLEYLKRNVDVLTTPHDIYPTVLDVLDLRKFWNPYRINGADLTRGMTLLETIPKNRSCSEAGIEPHWCSCLSWENVSDSDPLYEKSARALVDFINSLTESVRSKCVLRTLSSVTWVMRQKVNSGVLSFIGAKDADGYVGKFGKTVQPLEQNYQVKLIVGPGRGAYEGSMTYKSTENKFYIDTRDISRTNAYNDEPSCISATLPSLNMYCYCND